MFTESYIPQVNGVANFIQLLKRGLEQQGHTVHIFAPRISRYRDREKNIHRFPMFTSFDFVETLLGFELNWQMSLPMLRRYSDILSSLDIIHTHHMFVLGFSSAFFGRRRKIPIVFTNHTNYREFEAIMPAGSIFAMVLRSWFNLVSRLSTCVISPGERMTQQLRDYGIKKDIVIIPNAVEMEKFEPPHADEIKRLRVQYGIEEGNKVLIYIGRLSKEKNLVFLIRSLESLLAGEDNLKLLFVGDGKIKAQLERETRTLGLDDKIIFTGYIPYDQVHGYYFLGDIFVTASLSEVFPLTIIEALSCSVPIVAIDAVGTGDIVRHGYNGILVEEDERAFRDGVKKMIDDCELRKRMGKNAHESVKTLSVEQCVEKHLALYQRYSPRR